MKPIYRVFKKSVPFKSFSILNSSPTSVFPSKQCIISWKITLDFCHRTPATSNSLVTIIERRAKACELMLSAYPTESLFAYFLFLSDKYSIASGRIRNCVLWSTGKSEFLHEQVIQHPPAVMLWAATSISENHFRRFFYNGSSEWIVNTFRVLSSFF